MIMNLKILPVASLYFKIYSTFATAMKTELMFVWLTCAWHCWSYQPASFPSLFFISTCAWRCLSYPPPPPACPCTLCSRSITLPFTKDGGLHSRVAFRENSLKERSRWKNTCLAKKKLLTMETCRIFVKVLLRNFHPFS